MVFQHFNLFPHLRVIENLTLAPTQALRQSKSEARDRGRQLLERVGLGDKAERYPHQLSGGQQQRVAIARALMMDPRVMLFDEVTSALDPELVGDVLEVMRDLAESGMTMITVTHEMQFAREVGDRLVLMAEGVVVEEGKPREMLDRPQHERTSQFLRRLLRFHERRALRLIKEAYEKVILVICNSGVACDGLRRLERGTGKAQGSGSRGVASQRRADGRRQVRLSAVRLR